nr:hypothetical protein [Pseudovibrio sp. FO-BEG1]
MEFNFTHFDGSIGTGNKAGTAAGTGFTVQIRNLLAAKAKMKPDCPHLTKVCAGPARDLLKREAVGTDGSFHRPGSPISLDQRSLPAGVDTFLTKRAGSHAEIDNSQSAPFRNEKDLFRARRNTIAATGASIRKFIYANTVGWTRFILRILGYAKKMPPLHLRLHDRINFSTELRKIYQRDYFYILIAINLKA